MPNTTRASLLERLRDGTDPLAWDEFFRTYWPVIYAFARSRGCSDHTAEDIVQDVLLRVFEQKDIFRYDPERGRFRDWLGTVVRNKVAECRRRPSERIRPRGEGGGDGEAALEPAGDGERPDEAWERAFENGLLLVLLDVVRRETNPRDYLAFELLALQDLPGRQVARLTGVTRNAAYKACRRVLKRLRELGGSYAEDGRLPERVKEALRLRPAAAAERAVTSRLERTMRTR